MIPLLLAALAMQGPPGVAPVGQSETQIKTATDKLAAAKATFDADMRKLALEVDERLAKMLHEARERSLIAEFKELERLQTAYHVEGSFPNKVVNELSLVIRPADARRALESVFRDTRNEVFKHGNMALADALEEELRVFASTLYLAPWTDILDTAPVNGGDGGWRRTTTGLQSPDKARSTGEYVFTTFEGDWPASYVVQCTARFLDSKHALRVRVLAADETSYVCEVRPTSAADPAPGETAEVTFSILIEEDRAAIEIGGLQSLLSDVAIVGEQSEPAVSGRLGLGARAGAKIHVVRAELKPLPRAATRGDKTEKKPRIVAPASTPVPKTRVTDALKVGSVWQGTAKNMTGTMGWFILTVTHRQGDAFEGVSCHQSFNLKVVDYGLFRVRGRIDSKGNSVFTEERALHGGYPEVTPGFIVGVEYQGKLDGSNVAGTWKATDPGSQKPLSGDFFLVFAD